jgi:DNA-binding beta-propeller fold protein YncE
LKKEQAMILLKRQRWLRNWMVWAGSLALALTTTLPAGAQGPLAGAGHKGRGKIVVADRGSGTITLISTRNHSVIDTLELPTGDNPPEPMYVYYTPIRNRFFVGDRANDRVVAYNARTLEVDGMVPTGVGVFHMWGNYFNQQLWVNNDIENTSTVIDMRTLEVITTVPTPADLVAAGGKPHDVILAPGGRYAYVSVLGVDGDNDYVVQYCTESFEELGRAPVGQDPHLSLTWRNDLLYVPCQNTNDVHILNRWSLETIKVLAIPGAHGAGMALNGRHFYTTNLTGGGEQAVWTIDTRTNEVVGDPADAPYAVPHNIALTPNGRKLYVTHSGANDKVTVYRARGQGVPVYVDEVTTGTNPFGLAWVP